MKKVFLFGLALSTLSSGVSLASKIDYSSPIERQATKTFVIKEKAEKFDASKVREHPVSFQSAGKMTVVTSSAYEEIQTKKSYVFSMNVKGEEVREFLQGMVRLAFRQDNAYATETYKSWDDFFRKINKKDVEPFEKIRELDVSKGPVQSGWFSVHQGHEIPVDFNINSLYVNKLQRLLLSGKISLVNLDSSEALMCRLNLAVSEGCDFGAVKFLLGTLQSEIKQNVRGIYLFFEKELVFADELKLEGFFQPQVQSIRPGIDCRLIAGPKAIIHGEYSASNLENMLCKLF